MTPGLILLIRTKPKSLISTFNKCKLISYQRSKIMKTSHYCQSCHMPLVTSKDRGTEMDGAASPDYCWHCYQNGSFTNPFMTLQDMETHIRSMMSRQHEEERVIHYVLGTLPGLKRWEKEYQV